MRHLIIIKNHELTHNSVEDCICPIKNLFLTHRRIKVGFVGTEITVQHVGGSDLPERDFSIALTNIKKANFLSL